MYEIGKLTLGQAAEIAGYSKRDFMELMGNYGIKYISYPASELKEDFINELELLKKLYKKVYITSFILKEYGKTLPDYFIIENASNQKLIKSLIKR